MQLRNILGFLPRDIRLYQTALMHKSLTLREKGEKHINNERLEYLGDAVLSAVVADILYQRYPNKQEGFLTTLRSKLVRRDTLNKLAVQMGLDKLVLYSGRATSAHNSYMNGNAFEAFFGAIYLDRGYEYCMSFARDVIFKKYINIEEVSKTEENYKSKLIEWCQKYQFEFKFDIVSQKILQDRNTPKFVSRVTIEGVYCGTGDGYSKKASHQKAAQQEQTQTGQQTQPQVPLPKTKRTLKKNGYKLKFKMDVLVEKPLNANSEPLDLKIKVKKNYRKIKWKPARKPGSVDGYIVLKQKGNKGAYKQIAVLGPSAKSYKDKKAKRKNKADYTVVGYRKTAYGIRISPCSGYGRAPGRKYQNPSKYVQIKNKISKHGLHYYTSPVLVNNKSTKKQHIEAMIKTAYKYEGDPFTNRWSRAPGQGVDCSGLVMQACYGAGVDLWPSNPYRHRWGPARYEWESREIARNDKLRTVPFRDRKRGDLIFFCNSWGTVIHVAIYLGNNRLIHSTIQRGVSVTGMGGWGTICKVNP